MDSVTRRSFLVTVGLGTPAVAFLAACGGDDGGSSGDTSGDSAGGSAPGTASAEQLSPDGSLPDEYFVNQRWFPAWMVPGAQRLPVSFSDKDGLLPQGPATVRGRIIDSMTGDVIADNLTGERRQTDPGSVPYWVFEAEVPAVGIYAVQVEGADESGAGLQIVEPDDVPVAKPGDKLPGFDTPTVDDNRGVDPICTLTPDPCPLHEVTLNQALAAGKPVALLIGTPAYCQTGTCSPALEGLVSLRDEYGDRVTMVHAEVYTDDTATETTPIIQSYGMDYEPALWVTDASGTVVTRLDAVFNTDEIRAALDAVV